MQITDKFAAKAYQHVDMETFVSSEQNVANLSLRVMMVIDLCGREG